MTSADKLFRRPTPRLQHRCLHLDLKGMPPTSKRLLQLPGILETLRINAVLVEWEDTYPWKQYPQLRSPTAYSRPAVQKFIQELAARGIEVIPWICRVAAPDASWNRAGKGLYQGASRTRSGPLAENLYRRQNPPSSETA